MVSMYAIVNPLHKAEFLFLFLKWHFILTAIPEWKEKPTSKNLTVGENATFHCSGSGVPDPSLEWTGNGNPLSGEGKFPTVEFLFLFALRKKKYSISFLPSQSVV